MIVYKNATNAWLKVLSSIRANGNVVALKGVETIELINNSVAFDMRYPFIQHEKRFVNWKFLGAEIESVCNGDNRIENLAKYNQNMAQFSDDGYILNGAYGPPFNHQLMYALNTLSTDLLSRQAVISIWKQNPIMAKDIRCTLSIQFLVRNGLLHSVVNMRSSDAIWGLTYDFPLFTFMTLRLLTLLNTSLNDSIELGHLFWNGASSHYYDRHYDLVDKILDYEIDELNDENITRLPNSLSSSWKEVVEYYRNIDTRTMTA